MQTGQPSGRQVGCKEPGFFFAWLPEGEKMTGMGMLLGQGDVGQPQPFARLREEGITPLPGVSRGELYQVTAFLAQDIVPAPAFE